MKLNSEDFREGGLTRDEAIRVSGMLANGSVDAIELSGGTMASPMNLIPPRPGSLPTLDKEVFYKEAAKVYKQKVSIPLILVGGIRSYEVAERLVRDGMTDYISLSRPLICEPGSSSAGGKVIAVSPNASLTTPVSHLRRMEPGSTA